MQPKLQYKQVDSYFSTTNIASAAASPTHDQFVDDSDQIPLHFQIY
jgi:hypothetical protein